MDNSSSAKIGRRAILSGGGVAAAGIIIAEAPLVYNFGRRQLAIELAKLEGVALDAASQAADLTYQAVEYVVEPIAQSLSGISAESLDLAINAVEAAENVAGTLGVDKSAFATLDTILKAWRVNVLLIPQTVTQLNTVERDAAKKYLTALKAKQLSDARAV